ncbi:MAG: LacI family DNA-binding transcriptional regulator [Rariglobus sp.]
MADSARRRKPVSNVVTLSDVAKKAGVSRAAASMGLRGSAEISVMTRKRLKEVAEVLGYRPDPMLAALVARRGHRRTPANLAILVDDRWRFSAEGTAGGWLDVCLKGIRGAAERYGYTADELLLEGDLRRWRNPDRVLAARGVRGLLVLPFLDDAVSPPALDWERHAVVTVGNPASMGMRWHRAGTDAFAAMDLVCDQLKARGVRRAGLVQCWDIEKRLRFEGLGALSKEWHLPSPELDWVRPHLPVSLTRAGFLGWFKEQRPEVVITQGDDVLDWLRAARVRVPEDVGVVLLNRDFSAHADAAGICKHMDQVGECAVELMHSQILRGEMGAPAVSREMLVRPHWVEGSTLRARNPGN